MIAWPDSYLPAPSFEYNYESDSDVIRTRMDSGYVRQRRRSALLVRRLSVRWEMTDIQLANFQGFFQDLLNSGADWFTMELPLGDGFQTYQLRFTTGYKIAYRAHMHWAVNASLEIFNQVPYDSEWNKFIYIIGGDIPGFLKATNALHVLVHTILPTRF